VVSRVVEKGLAVMGWLQKCAKAVADSNQPIYWQVPSGYVVRHFYGQTVDKRVELKLSGERVRVTVHERTAKLSAKEQLQGIAPNFIHSLDGAALMLCLKRCREAGIEDFSSVHDAYGTHAANMNALAQFLREAFVEVHEHDVLGEFRSACQRILVDVLVAEKGMDPLEASEKADEMLPEPLEKGNLDLASVLESDYFFA
jgi:DNA-directed RNA polymerase